MGCCCSTPAVTETSQICLTEVHIPERSGLGDGVLPESSSITGQNRVKQTPRMEVDSLLGNVFVNQYLIIKELGSGSFGRVKLCLNLDDNCLYALKVVSKKKLKRHLLAGRKRFFGGNLPDEDLLHEINVMKSLEHENVVRLFEVIDDPHDDKLLMVMEYVEGGPVVSEEALMSGQFRGTTEDIARNHFRDLIKGLDYLHYQNVIHRDIKPENLLLTETGTVKLSDFGSACHNPDGNDTMSDTCGTRIFFAPEMCRGTEYSGKKADIYAAGVVLYVLLFHRLPFEDQPPDRLYEKIKNEEPDYSGRPDISADAIDLLKGLLVKDPRKRLSLEQIMSHVWFTNRSNLMDIKSAKVLSVPAIDVSTKMPTSAMIPSINSVFQTIPDKQMKHFTAGSYIIKAGERLTGVYLILKGLCLVTQGNFDSVDDASDVSGDADFPDEVGAVELPSQSQFSSGPGVELFNALSQPSGELTDLATQELARFQSLSRQEVVKGVGRRTTYQHTKLKDLVEQAAAVEENMQPNATKTASKKAPGKSRRGPGCIIGLDLAKGSDISPKTIKVLEPIDAVFVQKESLESVFSGAEQQLQLRLLVAKLQKMELMRETVQKLSDLRPDILQMEQLRAVIRNTSQTQSTGEN